MELNISFPSQKRPFKKKNIQWRKDCVNAGESNTLWRNVGLRKSFYNKKINFNLYSDILDPNDVEKVCNPLGILGLNSPAKMQNYPICNPKIDVLVGESIKRKFDWKLRVVNEDAISEKESELQSKFQDLMTSHIQQMPDEKIMQKELEKFQKFKNFEYQDLRERTGTHILKYLYHQQRLEQKFAMGFKDALISAEEIFHCDIISGEPVVMKLNNLNVHCIRSGDSNKIEDSSIIVIHSYMPTGQIIDEYHEYLEPDEIDLLESGLTNGPSNQLGIDIGRKPDLAIKMDEGIDLALLKGDWNYGYGVDLEGNIRVTKVYWKSMRKFLQVKSYDEFGDAYYHLEDENYKIDKSLGEEAKEQWMSEWWEGHKIGGGFSTGAEERAIYCKMQPRPIQFRSMENPSKCHPGIVGRVFNTNDNQAVSLMDRMKPYQYLYNVLAYSAELAVAKNYGKIMRLDLASIPENWQVDQWLSFAQGMNLAVYDSFKEGNKGAAEGKIAGSMQAQTPVIDMEMGNTIQLYMNMMAFIKQQMGEISGVSDQRQGQIETREAVNNVERSMQQTNAITEYWFMEHEQVKLAVMEVLLETAKFAWKGKKSKKLQYVTDDGSSVMLEIDGEQFNECEYGLQLTTNPQSQELLSAMKSLAQAALQSGMLTFSQLLDIYSTESLTSIRRKIEAAEEQKFARDKEASDQQQQMAQEQMVHEAQQADKDRDFKREEWDREAALAEADLRNKLEIERLRQDNVQSNSHTEVTDQSFTLEDLRIQAEKIKTDYHAKLLAIKETERHNKETEAAKVEENKIKKVAAHKKPTTKK